MGWPEKGFGIGGLGPMLNARILVGKQQREGTFFITNATRFSALHLLEVTPPNRCYLGTGLYPVIHILPLIFVTLTLKSPFCCRCCVFFFFIFY